MHAIQVCTCTCMLFVFVCAQMSIAHAVNACPSVHVSLVNQTYFCVYYGNMHAWRKGSTLHNSCKICLGPNTRYIPVCKLHIHVGMH